MRRSAGREISMIFQEPMTSLNPVFSCGDQIAEVLELHERLPRAAARARAIELLRTGRDPDARAARGRVPAPALGRHAPARDDRHGAGVPAGAPDRRRADHGARRDDPGADSRAARAGCAGELGMAVLLITHDLGVVAETADRVAVMYAGQVVEYARRACRCSRRPRPPVHGGPARLAAAPRARASDRLRVIPGGVPNPARFPRGCRFHPRCPIAQERCRREMPPLESRPDGRARALLARGRDRRGHGRTRSRRRAPTPLS